MFHAGDDSQWRSSRINRSSGTAPSKALFWAGCQNDALLMKIQPCITQIAAGAEELKLGALAPTRDFNHVSDTVRAFAVLAACDAAVGQTVNVGSGFEISIGDTAALIAELMGAAPRIVEDGQRLRPALSEVERLWADASLMTRLTGWTPAYGGRDGFRRGLEDTIAWFREPANLSAYHAERYVL